MLAARSSAATVAKFVHTPFAGLQAVFSTSPMLLGFGLDAAAEAWSVAVAG